MTLPTYASIFTGVYPGWRDAMPFPGLQGRSLRSPRTEESEPIYTEDRALAHLGQHPTIPRCTQGHSVSHGKLLTSSEGPLVFYDLSSDPGELKNV